MQKQGGVVATNSDAQDEQCFWTRSCDDSERRQTRNPGSGVKSVSGTSNKTATSQVGAISKAQKAQNIFLEKNLKFSRKKFLSENVAQCRKM